MKIVRTQPYINLLPWWLKGLFQDIIARIELGQPRVITTALLNKNKKLAGAWDISTESISLRVLDT